MVDLMNIRRLLHHLTITEAQVRRSFSPETRQRIEQAIATSENQHGGELRFIVERALEGTALWQALWNALPPRERAIELFSSLRIWDTEHNSGVLIYVLLADRSVEIVADRGIHAKVGESAWTMICEAMENRFRKGEFESGALEGIESITRLLATHFPPALNDKNELPDFPAII